MTVSIIMPTKNRFTYVERALKSVLSQTFDDWELVVLDDSGEEAHARISEFRKVDDRIKIVPRPPNIGPCEARRIGTNFCAGPFVTFIDSDDYYLPDRLLLHTQAWEANPDIGLSYDSWSSSDAGENDYVERQRKGLPEGRSNPPFTAKRLFNGNFIHASSGFTTKKIIESLGGYPETPLVCDWYLYIRICEKFPAYRIGRQLSVKDSRAPRRLGTYQSSRVTRDFIVGKRRILFDNLRIYGEPFMKDLLLFVPISLKNRDGNYLKQKASSFLSMLTS